MFPHFLKKNLISPLFLIIEKKYWHTSACQDIAYSENEAPEYSYHQAIKENVFHATTSL